MYMGTPYVMYKINPKLMEGKTASFNEALKAKVGTYTAPLTGFEAMAQILTVPVSLAVLFTSFGFVLITMN